MPRCRAWMTAVATGFLLSVAPVRAQPPTESPGPSPGGSDPTSRTAVLDENEYSGPERDQVFFAAYWNQGIKYRLLGQIKVQEDGHLIGPRLTRDPLLVGEIGIKLHVDAAAYVEADGLQQLDPDIDIRRSFLIVRGTFFNFLHPIDFNVEMGALRNDFYVDQAFLAVDKIPYLGTFKIGQYTAPFSFESKMNSRDIGLMEAASPVQAFTAGQLAGAQFANQLPQRRITWALGLFGRGQQGEVGDASEDFARTVGRATWVPLQDDSPGQTSLLHLGISGSYLFATGNLVRYQSRPESFLAPVAIDTGPVDAAHAFAIGTEIAFVRGGMSGQAEYIHTHASGGAAGSVDFPGLYVQINQFLTGEHRPYNYRAGVFDQVVPHRPFSIRKRTWGSWEWGMRYSYTNLDSGPVRGGTMNAATAGLNWYWNRYIRMQFNYGLSLIDEGVLDGRLNVFQMRLQLVI